MDQIEQWYQDNRTLFHPSNARPNPKQLSEIFVIANLADPKGNHKPTSCGRCLYNAKAAIQKYINTHSTGHSNGQPTDSE